VSNLRPIKRPLDAIETLAKVRASGIAARLLIVGDGPLLEAMSARAVELGVGDDVIWAGAQEPEFLARYIAASDLMLVTSESESFCLAALEAMACGVPVVGTHCGGLDEVMAKIDRGVDRTSKLLVDVGDTERMAATCVDLMTHPKRYQRVQKQCLATPLERYPQNRQAQGYLTLAESLR
jgi:glycosyltransferase involved in cell wall biosynthesis